MTIEITPDYDSEHFSVRIMDTEAALFLTAEAVRDIAHALAAQASEEAPLGETEELKAHPVDVNELRRYHSGHIGNDLAYGQTVTEFPSFGGGFTVRGAGGRFVKGGSTLEPGTRGTGRSFFGEDIEEIEVTLPDHPHYAKFVHNGTGIYGKFEHPIIPVHNKFLKFTYHGIKYLLPSVYGQEANPYLERAFIYIRDKYVPVKIEALQTEIRIIT